MTDLSKLKVSLTKHGAYKVAELIKAFPKDEILNNTWDKYKGIRIDRAQTMKNLSGDSSGILPSIWDEIKDLGDEEIENLVLIAIIFSHHKLIKTMIAAQSDEMKGTIKRGKVIDDKAYTNFACVLDELGFATEHTTQHISYDLSRLFRNEELPRLVRSLITLKLKASNWNESTDLIDECIRLNLHGVFAISAEYFRNWLDGEIDAVFSETKVVDEIDEDHATTKEFQFRSGHKPKQEGEVDLGAPKHIVKANLLHNEIQNKLYKYLVEIYGENDVGAEIPDGFGASVDLVLKEKNNYTFYEIKTDTSVKSCIRHAISQLLEYAYWPEEERAQKLIIISQNPITNEAKQYLSYLRSKFGMPIYYQRFNMNAEELENMF